MADNSGGKRMAVIHADVKEILDIVKGIEVSNALRDAKIESIKILSEKNYTCLEGNGKPGLKSDVEHLQDNMALKIDVIKMQENMPSKEDVLNLKTKMKVATWAGTLAGGAMILDFLSRVFSVP